MGVLTIVVWVKMLNNGIRIELIEKMRIRPEIEGCKRVNYVDIRGIPGEGTASQGSIPAWQVPGPAMGPVCVAIDQEYGGGVLKAGV